MLLIKPVVKKLAAGVGGTRIIIAAPVFDKAAQILGYGDVGRPAAQLDLGRIAFLVGGSTIAERLLVWRKEGLKCSLIDDWA